MANSNLVDRETPWCSACNQYAEFLTRTTGAGESERTLIVCKDCNEEMWSATSCRRQALVFKLMCLMVVGVCGYGIWAVPSVLARVVLPLGGLVSLLVVYKVGPWRKCSQHLQKFEEFAVQKAQNLYADRD